MSPTVFRNALIGLVLIAAMTALISWQRSDAAAKRDAYWLAKENSELAAAQTKYIQMQDAYRAMEGIWRKSQAEIVEKYQKELSDAEIQKNYAVTTALSGERKLRFKTTFVGRKCTDGGGAADMPNPNSVDYGGAGGELRQEVALDLPPGIAAELTSIAFDADRNTRQLSACQANLLVCGR